MELVEVEGQLREYIATARLGGDDSELESQTPLLAWGLLDSLSVAELVTFIEERFSVTVPAEQVTAANLETLEAMSRWVASLR